MKLQQQVTSLELSKRLKELGVKQESLFYWAYADETTYLTIKDGHDKIYSFDREDNDELNSFEFYPNAEFYSALTAAELGELLPPFVKQKNSGEMVNLQMQKMDEDEYCVRIMSYTDQVYGVKCKTEADILIGKMYLKYQSCTFALEDQNPLWRLCTKAHTT